MKACLVLIFLFVITFTVHNSIAQTASPSPVVVNGAVSTPGLTAPAPTPTVTVPEASTPPQWVLDVLASAQKLPTIGPIISKAVVYLGVLCSLLTGLVAFLLTGINALKGVVNLAGLADFAAKLEAFKDGKILYYLKFFSAFNAQKTALAPAPSDQSKPV